DARLLWEWANDPGVRRSSFSSQPISWEIHMCWFAQKLKDSRCLIFLGVDRDDLPVGQVRLELVNGSEAEIHVSIAKERRGSGWGPRLIQAAVEHGTRNYGLQRIHALIKPDNSGSLKAFRAAGFKQVGTKVVKGHEAVHTVLDRAKACGKELNC